MNLGELAEATKYAVCFLRQSYCVLRSKALDDEDADTPIVWHKPLH